MSEIIVFKFNVCLIKPKLILFEIYIMIQYNENALN